MAQFIIIRSSERRNHFLVSFMGKYLNINIYLQRLIKSATIVEDRA
jgi:hypothetical protein